MNWMRDKKIIPSLLTLVCTVILCGCGDEIPDMTPEQTELVTEYSAALLLKYDSNTPSRLLPEGSVAPIVYIDPFGDGAVETQIVPDTDTQPDIPVDSDPEFTSDELTVTDTTTGESSGPSAHPEGFSGFLDGTGVDITYTGNYEITDSYPKGDDLNPYFTVDASAGNELLVLHFALANVSDTDVSISLGGLNLRYRVSLNGGKNKFIDRKSVV